MTTSNLIKRLSEATINKISAGEVVERPASVIKELVENAIDAGADRLDIRLEDAGKNLIIISDNGSGMSKEDLMLSVERHATSKLDEDDITNITKMGFRGEALAAIASISRLTIISKRSIDEYGHKLTIAASKDLKVTEIAANTGSIIEVRDLFFTTPARLKFLKGDKAELDACVKTIKTIALAHPSIAFKLIHNDKEILQFSNQSANRIYDILAPKEDLIPLPTSQYVTGLISKPSASKSNSNNQYFFVNQRPIKDKIFATALKIAYQDYELPAGKYPTCAIFLTLPAEEVDVNVHPTKAEVRFQDSSKVMSILIQAIKAGLVQENSLANSLLDDLLEVSQVNATKSSSPSSSSSRSHNSSRYDPDRSPFQRLGLRNIVGHLDFTEEIAKAQNNKNNNIEEHTINELNPAESEDESDVSGDVSVENVTATNSTPRTEHDSYFKSMLSIPEIAREFLKERLPENISKILDLGSIKSQPTEFISEALQKNLNDMLFSVELDGQPGFIYTLVEHQSSVQQFMAYRMLKYTTLIIDDYLLNNPKAEKLPIVVPMVFYNGKPNYTATTELAELFTHPELAIQSLSGYKLIDLGKMDKETLLHNKMLAFLEYVMQPKKKIDIIQVYKGLSESIRLISFQGRNDLITYIFDRSAAYFEKYLAAQEFTEEKSEELRNLLKQTLNNEKIVEDIMYGTFAQKYIDVGIPIGKQEGIPIGIEIGEQRKMKQMAEKMLRAKKPIEEIILFTELSEQEIAEIKQSMK